MPFALTVLVVAQLVGEILRHVLHLPLPGPVIGMFLLAVLLATKGRRWLADERPSPTPLVQTADTLIQNMGLLFVPAGVGIVTELGVVRHAWLPIVIGLLVSTLLGLMVTGLVMHRYASRTPALTSEGEPRP